MKKGIFIVSLFIVLQVIVFSCQKEQMQLNEKDLSGKSGKVEITLEEAGLTMKDKVVTLASIEEIEQLDLSSIYRPIKGSTKAPEIGILKDGSCGGYRHLQIFMDCEDKNTASWLNKYYNWNGEIYIDTKQNVELNFCMVPSGYFERSRLGDYAVLAVDLKYAPPHTDIWQRFFDNEDDNNINHATADGIPVTSYGVNDFVSNGENMLLYFFYYPQFPDGMMEFPLINGINSYSVFGKLNGVPYAELQIDDEDTQNLNYSTKQAWNNTTYNHDPPVPAFVQPGVFNFGLASLSQFYVSDVY